LPSFYLRCCAAISGQAIILLSLHDGYEKQR
jgi:hypothetical protein